MQPGVLLCGWVYTEWRHDSECDWASKKYGFVISCVTEAVVYCVVGPSHDGHFSVFPHTDVQRCPGSVHPGVCVGGWMDAR